MRRRRGKSSLLGIAGYEELKQLNRTDNRMQTKIVVTFSAFCSDRI